MHPADDQNPLLAISSCLLGQNVRFDGAHKRDSWLVNELGRYVDYQPFCPEVAIGLGIPRPPIRLVGTAENMRAVGVKDPGLDLTERLADFAHQTVTQLDDVSGQAAYQRLGRLLSDLKQQDLEAVAELYEAELMAALARRVSRKRHVNVLQHMQGYLKKQLDGGDKQELGESIEAYGRGEIPLIVPVFLLRHHFRRNPDPYIAGQWYLQPYPDDLGLRNTI